MEREIYEKLEKVFNDLENNITMLKELQKDFIKQMKDLKIELENKNEF